MYSSDLPYTLLSLEDYARTMNLDPLQFRSAVTALKTANQCSDVWYEYAWQDGGKISRQELLQVIADAEEDLAGIVGYWSAPRWIADEAVDYPQFYGVENRGKYGYSSRGEQKSVQTKYGYVLYGGRRTTVQIAANNVVRGSNLDTTGDTFEDMAVFTVTVPAALTNACELEAFFKAYSALDAVNCRTEPSSEGADEYWQIRDVRITLSGVTATVYVPIWQMIKPQLQRQIDADVIDGDLAASYVDTIEFWRVYNDPSEPAQFLWSNEAACSTTACAWSTQDGCLRVKDSRGGKVSVLPVSSYDSDTSAFTGASFNQGVEPNRVRLWYYAGYKNPYARGCGKMTTFWKRQIAKLASTRLNKPLCTCENIERTVKRWQENTILANQDRTFLSEGAQNNPLGTRVGEMEVWSAITKTTGIRKGKRIKA